MSNNHQCTLTEGFSIWEKLWAQLSFMGMGIIGTIAIIQYNWMWVFPYVFVYWYGIPGIIMRHTNCPRCPHLYEFGDCLQAPVFFTKWTIKNVERKFTPFTPIERFLFYLIHLVDIFSRLQKLQVSLKVVCTSSIYPCLFTRGQFYLHGRDDLFCQFVLNSKYIFQFSVIPFCP